MSYHKTNARYGLTLFGINVHIILTFEGDEGPTFSKVTNIIVKALELIGFERLPNK